MEQNRGDLDQFLGHVLRMVTLLEVRKNVSLVCKDGWAMEADTRTHLKVKNMDQLHTLLNRYKLLNVFETSRGVSDDNLDLVARLCPELVALVLDVVDCEEETKGLDFTEATRVKKEAHTVGRKGLRTLADMCTKLNKLVLRRGWIDKQGLVAVLTSKASILTHLDLQGYKLLSSKILKAISQCQVIICLSLRDCDGITRAGLGDLATGVSGKTMTRLDLSGSSNITNVGLRHFPDMAALTDLNLKNCTNLTDEAMAFICKIKSLLKLNISGCSEIKDDGMLHLSRMKSLEQLLFRNCSEITDKGGERISYIRNLKKLSISSNDYLTQQTFFHIGRNCQHLEELKVMECEIDADSVEAFVGHQSLRYLFIRTSELNDVTGLQLKRLALSLPRVEYITVPSGWEEELKDNMELRTRNRFFRFVDNWF